MGAATAADARRVRGALTARRRPRPLERAYEFERSSTLPATPDAVWAHATSMAGVNRELFPLARMTHPRGRSRLGSETVTLGRRLFRSWILLLGVLPVDYDDLTLVELTPGRGFRERSPMLTQREWLHERTIEPAAGGCTVTDRVRFVPRVSLLGPLQLRIFRGVFRLRHRNLARLFARRAGEAGASPAL